MTTDWWNTQTPTTGEDTGRPAGEEPSRQRSEPPVHPLPTPNEPGNSGPEGGQTSQSKAKKVVGGVAVAVVAGALLFGSCGKGGEGDATAPQATTMTESEVDGFFPPAGDGDPEADLPAAGGSPQGEVSRETVRQPEQQAASTVTITAEPSGKGRIGSVVTVTIRNGTSSPLTVLASLVKGDGRPAVVGEGTLAPGSRVVQPGESTQGTVEFASAQAPNQVALVDLSGNLIAMSNGS